MARFESPRLVASVAAALKRSGLMPRRLEIQITASLLMRNDAKNLNVLRALHDLGVRITMDDFGTGCPSWSNLHSFRFDEIKINRSFVSQLRSDDRSATVVTKVLALAGALGLATAAEGVEAEERLRKLVTKGRPEAQGSAVPSRSRKRSSRSTPHPLEPLELEKSPRIDIDRFARAP